jgi:hypothetical protein
MIVSNQTSTGAGAVATTTPQDKGVENVTNVTDSSSSYFVELSMTGRNPTAMIVMGQPPMPQKEPESDHEEEDHDSSSSSSSSNTNHRRPNQEGITTSVVVEQRARNSTGAKGVSNVVQHPSGDTNGNHEPRPLVTAVASPNSGHPPPSHSESSFMPLQASTHTTSVTDIAAANSTGGVVQAHNTANVDQADKDNDDGSMMDMSLSPLPLLSHTTHWPVGTPPTVSLPPTRPYVPSLPEGVHGTGGHHLAYGTSSTGHYQNQPMDVNPETAMAATTEISVPPPLPLHRQETMSRESLTAFMTQRIGPLWRIRRNVTEQQIIDALLQHNVVQRVPPPPTHSHSNTTNYRSPYDYSG